MNSEHRREYPNSIPDVPTDVLFNVYDTHTHLHIHYIVINIHRYGGGNITFTILC